MTSVADLDDREAAELGPLLRRAASVADRLVDADQVCNGLWSHGASGPVHVHDVVQPVTSDEMTEYGVHGPEVQVAKFAAGDTPDPVEVARLAARARDLFKG